MEGSVHGDDSSGLNQGALSSADDDDAFMRAPEWYTQKILNALPRGYVAHSAERTGKWLRQTD